MVARYEPNAPEYPNGGPSLYPSARPSTMERIAREDEEYFPKLARISQRLKHIVRTENFPLDAMVCETLDQIMAELAVVLAGVTTDPEVWKRIARHAGQMADEALKYHADKSE